MADQQVSGPEPEIVALQLRGPERSGGVAVLDAPPTINRYAQTELDRARYACRANRLSVRDELGRVVAFIEIVSPGNKDSENVFASFTGKAADFLINGIHLLMIDLFPTGPRDPEGLAHAIWDCVTDDPFAERPSDEPLTVASFDAGPPLKVYLETLGIGDQLPEAPLFLAPEWYVNVPLEQTYQNSWNETPSPIKNLVDAAVR